MGVPSLKNSQNPFKKQEPHFSPGAPPRPPTKIAPKNDYALPIRDFKIFLKSLIGDWILIYN